MKIHFIYVEEDGEIIWSCLPSELIFRKGHIITVDDDYEIEIDNCSWRVENRDDEVVLVLRDESGDHQLEALLRPRSLYAVRAKSFSTLLTEAKRTPQGFETKSEAGITTTLK